jgi:hypothetical protein
MPGFLSLLSVYASSFREKEFLQSVNLSLHEGLKPLFPDFVQPY